MEKRGFIFVTLSNNMFLLVLNAGQSIKNVSHLRNYLNYNLNKFFHLVEYIYCCCIVVFLFLIYNC